MTDRQRRIAREALDRALAHARPVERFRAPRLGWIRAIRDALGMSGGQLAARMGVSAQTVHGLERSEVAATISLERLQRAAEAMECTLVYALVPNRTLAETVERRRERVVDDALRRVDQTMALEDQSAEVEDGSRRGAFAEAVLKGRRLWDDP
jgi:predicted DNA-binding mobile mystery protein A